MKKERLEELKSAADCSAFVRRDLVRASVGCTRLEHLVFMGLIKRAADLENDISALFDAVFIEKGGGKG